MQSDIANCMLFKDAQFGRGDMSSCDPVLNLGHRTTPLFIFGSQIVS